MLLVAYALAPPAGVAVRQLRLTAIARSRELRRGVGPTPRSGTSKRPSGSSLRPFNDSLGAVCMALVVALHAGHDFSREGVLMHLRVQLLQLPVLRQGRF